MRRRTRIVEWHFADGDRRTRPTRGAAVNQQPVIGEVGDPGGGVGAAVGCDEAEPHRVEGVTDIEDMDSLGARWGEHATAITSPGWSRRVPGPHQDIVPDDDVALITGARTLNTSVEVVDLDRVVRLADVDDPEPFIGPLYV